MIRADRIPAAEAALLLRQALQPKRRHKYNARPVKKGARADGLTFPTQHEAKVYDQLRQLERVGEIVPGSIRLQVRYSLEVNGLHICNYIADFVHRDTATPSVDVVTDAKGVRTEEYKIKRALMQACHGVVIQEVGEERPSKARRKAAKRRTR